MDIDQGRELHHLLSPLSPRTFLEEHWGRRYLHLRGPRDKFIRLFDRGSFDRAITDVATTAFVPNVTRPILLASFPDPDGHPRMRTVEVSPHQVPALLALGSTVFCGFLDYIDGTVEDYKEGVAAQLSLPQSQANMTAFLSPPGCGLVGHSAPNHLFVMQIEGHKRWLFSAAPKRDIGDDEEYAADGEGELAEATLEPGDVLYLPPGTWHRAKAVEESLHLSIHTEQLSFLALFRRALADPEIKRRLDRRLMPLAFAEDIASGEALREVEKVAAEGLRDLRRALETIEPATLVAAWRRMIARETEPGQRE